MKGLENIAKGLSVKTLSNIFVMFSGLVISVLINRYFGKVNYGMLILAYSVINFCWSFSDLGSKATMNKYIPSFINLKQKNKVFSLISTGILYQAIGIIIFTVLMFLSAEFLATTVFKQKEALSLIKIGILFFIGFSFLDFLLQIFQSIQSWLKESILNIVYPVIYLSITCLLIFTLKINLSGVLLANAIATFIVIFIAILLLPEDIKSNIFIKLNYRNFNESRKMIFNFGLPILWNNLIFYILTWFDKLWLVRYKNIENLTYYYVAFIFLNSAITFFKTIYTILMPYLGGISYLSEQEIAQKFKLIFKWILQILIIMSIAAFFFIEPIILKLYGKDYFHSVIAFRILLIVFIIRGIINSMGMFLLNVFGMSKQSAILSTILLIASITMNILLIPLYGYKGAIYASIIAYGLYMCSMMLFIERIRRIIPINILFKNAFFSLLLAVVYFVLNLLKVENIFLLPSLLILLYICLLRISGEIDRKDIEALKIMVSLFKKRSKVAPVNIAMYISSRDI